MSSLRGRPGGFEAIKRQASAGDALAALQLERTLEMFLGGARTKQTYQYQVVKQKFFHDSSSANMGRAFEGERRLRRWIKGMEAAGCPLDVVLMAIVNGATFTSLDKKMRRRKGWSQEQLILALRIFRSN